MAWELILFGTALAAVSVGCLLPAGWLPPLPNDKVLHFGAYAALTLMALPMAGSWRELAYWLAGLLAAGAVIELLQNLVPGRSFCWRDLAANAAGITAASACAVPLMSFTLY
nr:VanZ family protein [uncultured Duganella sp.]